MRDYKCKKAQGCAWTYSVFHIYPIVGKQRATSRVCKEEFFVKNAKEKEN